MRRLLFSLILGIFLISFASAVCTVSFDRNTYSPTETITADMVCTESSEKSDAFTLNWTFNNGTEVELDTGTTPVTIGEHFFQTYIVPSTWPLNVFVNATLQGAQLEGTDFANITNASSNSLVISSSIIGGKAIGETTSLRTVVKDENGKKISGGLCKFSVWSNDETTMIQSSEGAMFDGDSKFDWILNGAYFSEGTGYAVKLICYCGSSGSNTECIDEDGVTVTNSVGTLKDTFVTTIRLLVNSVTDKNLYKMGEVIHVCANITSSANASRRDLLINYDYRCSSGGDTALDRVLFGDFTEKRGIDGNLTQVQCHGFTVPQDPLFDEGGTQCYASTDVQLINDVGSVLTSYHTTTPQFNLSIPMLHPITSWNRVSRNQFYTNVSLDNYDVGVKALFMTFNNLFTKEEFASFSVDSWTLNYGNGTLAPFTTRLDTHEMFVRMSGDLVDAVDMGGITILNMNTSDPANNGLNLTIKFTNFQERQTIALEGIEDKTGTFHLDIDCPSITNLGQDMDCVITAQIEEPQLVQKEVDFTCYITDGFEKYSSVNFNKMITKTSSKIAKSFYVPTTLGTSGSYIVQCHADYYNLGSRRDSFYDTFLTYPRGVGITGAAIGEGEIPEEEAKDKKGKGIFGRIISKIREIFKYPTEIETTSDYSFLGSILFLSLETISDYIFLGSILFLSLAGIVLGVIALIRKKKRKDFHLPEHMKFKWIKPLKILILILAFSLFIATLILGSIGISKLVETSFEGSKNIMLGTAELSQNYPGANSIWGYIILQDKLFRGMILISFIVLMIIILFKFLSIQGEIRFGDNYLKKRYHANKKQFRLNGLIYGTYNFGDNIFSKIKKFLK